MFAQKKIDAAIEKPKEEYMVLPFNNPSEYHGYKMFFLKKPILFGLNEPVELTRTMHHYKGRLLSVQDTEKLNNLFWRFNDELSITSDGCYFNGKNGNYTNERTGKPITFDDGFAWNISVWIQGYKESPNKVYSPIWKICDAKRTLLW